MTNEWTGKWHDDDAQVWHMFISLCIEEAPSSFSWRLYVVMLYAYGTCTVFSFVYM